MLRLGSWAHRSLFEAGVTAYCSVSHAAPVHGESHAHAPFEHTPFSEQSTSVVPAWGGHVQ